jgi:glycosyltransferase involved in cell wall biosynthesis
VTTSRLSYALVTPARDEAEHLPRLACAVAAQTVRPAVWVIVDDASTDGTRAIARRLAAEHPWVRVLGVPCDRRLKGQAVPSGRRAGRDVIAFEAGVASLDQLPEVVVKLDADVSFAPDFFDVLLWAFEQEPTLGIAGGTCLERTGGVWAERHVTGAHVWGAVRGYRRRCLEDVRPLEVRLGWDGIDLLRAELAGWRTRTLRHAPFRHHRAEGAREGAKVRAWFARGWSAWYMGYRPTYVLARTIHRASREPAAFALLWGYVRSALAREARYPERAVRDVLRQQQRLRFLPLRLRETLGRRS